jgi:hypothetical protein
MIYTLMQSRGQHPMRLREHSRDRNHGAVGGRQGHESNFQRLRTLVAGWVAIFHRELSDEISHRDVAIHSELAPMSAYGLRGGAVGGNRLGEMKTRSISSVHNAGAQDRCGGRPRDRCSHLLLESLRRFVPRTSFGPGLFGRAQQPAALFSSVRRDSRVTG